jgi:4-diphosphocytidyl-2-C-methyl-D-erythritol kinase
MELAAGLEWFPAPAKLNLFLHVLGRRDDGMHELQTVFRLIDRADRIGVRVRPDRAIERIGNGPGIPAEEDLCVRAARKLQQFRGSCPGAEIALEKHLPVGGGLGGGSSDAATVLLVLNRLWGIGLSRARLMALALELGADVPFFVFGRNAIGEGVGERLTALSLPDRWYLVLTPRTSVATAAVFADNALTRNTKALKIPPFFFGLGRNDLEPVVTRRHPEIAAHLAWLRARSAEARMTGSGGCVFAEFAAESEAREAHAALPEGMRGFVARGLDRHPLHDWAGGTGLQLGSRQVG